MPRSARSRGPVGGRDDADRFDRRRKIIHGLLSAIPGVVCPVPEGAFYAFPSFEGRLGQRDPRKRSKTTLELAEVVLEEAMVAFVPGEAFGAPGYARFSYALSDEDVIKGVTRVAELFAEAKE